MRIHDNFGLLTFWRVKGQRHRNSFSVVALTTHRRCHVQLW